MGWSCKRLGRGRGRCRAKRMAGTLMRARRVLLLNNAAVNKRREGEGMRGNRKKKEGQRGFMTKECQTTIYKLRQARVLFFSQPHIRMQTFFISTRRQITHRNTHTNRKYNLLQPDTCRNCLRVYESVQNWINILVKVNNEQLFLLYMPTYTPCTHMPGVRTHRQI